MLDLHLKGTLTEEQVEETANKLIEIMDAEDLMCDMEPVLNEEDNLWYLSLSNEDGDSDNMVAFDSEEEAARVADLVVEKIDARETA